ncbi:aldo/keto reductase [Aquihabitans sp. McL0605]|uniref:aldo/keto reductase n=1 Tax=Aquihabitans sp. McL0605 TaxID=3415671 RepID=UPI003CEE1B0F
MLPRLLFGRTGHESSRLIFGAAALSAMSPERADRTLDQVWTVGINHIDTAASYGDSELRLAPFLADHRDDVFLASKTDQRTASGARRQVEASLERLGVDHLDLIQLHNLVEPDEWAVAHGPGGAVEGLVAAREEGLVRHIGVTGHGLRIAESHRRSLEAFDYDSVLLPYNHVLCQDPAYLASFDSLLVTCADRGVAVQTIKAIARRRWQADADGPRFAWYEPLPPGPALDRAVAFVLGRDGIFLNTSSDANLLAAIVAAAEAGAPVPSAAELQGDVEANDMAPLFDGGALDRI